MGKHKFPTADQLVALVEDHGTISAVCKQLGIPSQTMHAYISRLELDDASIRNRIDGARRLSTAKTPRGTVIDWPARSDLVRLLREAPTVAAAATSLGVSVQSLHSRCTKEGISTKQVRSKDTAVVKGDHAELTASELKSAHELMRERGLSEDEWRVSRCVVNEWGLDPESGEPYKQFKLFLERKPDLDWIFPADDQPARKPPKIRKASKGRPQLWVLVSDHQVPLHSEAAHNAFLRFCEAVKPDCGVHLGDLIDLSNISRFGDSGDPKFNATVMDCVNEGYLILKDIVEASPATRWHFMLGNHDERIRTESLRRAERIWGIRPADIPGEDKADDALSIKNILRLDRLGITCIDEPAGYKHNRLRIGDDFEIRHGMFTGSNPAAKTMDSLQASVAVGHTHAKSHAFKALFDRDGISTIVQGAEIGHMAQNNLGYNHGRSDWHPGWATVTLFPDGQTNLEHVVFDEQRGKATWRDQQF